MNNGVGLRTNLRLHLADGVGAVLFRRLIDAFGDAEAAIAAGPTGWRNVEGIGPKTADAIVAVSDAQIDDELAAAERFGARIVCDGDDEYPAALKSIYGRPAVLYIRGRLEATDAIAFAIVGARRCTHYGLEQSERFGELLGRAGFTIISGGARGIDTAAHRGALAAGGRTVAVMGCGLSTAYPSENAELFERIVADDRGALISELPMNTAVLGGNFPTRNRIVSGLSLGVLVIEAARRSGALITARIADEQGRVVFALPGRADSLMSQGANALIRDGAILTQNLEDILEHLGEVGESMSAEEPPPGEFITPGELNEIESTLLDALSGGPLALDELVRSSKLSSGDVVSTMTMLVLKGAVAQRPGNIFARKTRGAGK